MTKLDFHYQKMELREEQLESFFDLAEVMGIGGVNVTMPYKKKVLKYCQHQSKEVKAIGAANVLHWSKRGLIAHNTDVAGLNETFLFNQWELKKKRAIILGAGGAARAVVYALMRARIDEVSIWARKKEQAHELVENFQSKIILPVTDLKAEMDFDLIVNCTPCGQGKLAKDYRPLLPPDWQAKNKEVMGLDLIYSPQRTAFLKELSAKGVKKLSNGLDMFVAQAMASFEIWHGPIAMAKRKKIFLQLKQLVSKGKT